MTTENENTTETSNEVPENKDILTVSLAARLNEKGEKEEGYSYSFASSITVNDVVGIITSLIDVYLQAVPEEHKAELGGFVYRAIFADKLMRDAENAPKEEPSIIV